MASNKTLIPHHSPLLSLTIISLLSLSYSLSYPSNSIHDLLRWQGLPAGLFPKNIKSYSLDPNFVLEVQMEEPCLAKYESRVFFDYVVRANLSYGNLNGVQGLSQEDLFLWLPIKGIIVYDPTSGLITFDIGLAYKQFAFSTFDEPKFCEPIGHKFIDEFGMEDSKLGFGRKQDDRPNLSSI